MKAWLMRRPNRYAHLQTVPLRQLAVMLLAVFLLFSGSGFYVDLMNKGSLPYVVVFANAVFGGLNAVAWILVLARLPRIYLLCMYVLQVLSWPLNYQLGYWVETIFRPSRVALDQGIPFAATAILVTTLSSYVCFVAYIRVAGKETFRLRNELDAAHSIQKTLVPPLTRRTPAFEIYGISEPSEKVGGDLVDVVELRDGSSIAYLADIAGHGLQAGILMGMLKAAARTALLDGACEEGGAALSLLMQRLNLVLPGVKEPHMYATFTGLRLDEDGAAFYGMAASPPLLHWSAASGAITRTEECQFPLGLLPVGDFPATEFAMQPGDVALVATDGVLEVCANEGGAEYGVEALESRMRAGARLPLPELAQTILDGVRSYGKQQDDQTLLLVRRIG